jgi:hypothetical protein
MDITWAIAILGAVVTAFGWLVTHILSTSAEKRRHSLISQMKFTVQQLEELYGPLAFLLLEGRQTFQAFIEAIGRDHFRNEDIASFSDSELKAWLFWIDTDFFPRNEKIKKLLSKKTHLIEGGDVPESYLTFLDHHNSWKICHERWLQQKIPYGWHSKVGWPDQFENDVLRTFSELKKRHAILIGMITETPSLQQYVSRRVQKLHRKISPKQINQKASKHT